MGQQGPPGAGGSGKGGAEKTAHNSAKAHRLKWQVLIVIAARTIVEGQFTQLFRISPPLQLLPPLYVRSQRLLDSTFQPTLIQTTYKMGGASRQGGLKSPMFPFLSQFLLTDLLPRYRWHGQTPQGAKRSDGLVDPS